MRIPAVDSQDHLFFCRFLLQIHSGVLCLETHLVISPLAHVTGFYGIFTILQDYGILLKYCKNGENPVKLRGGLTATENITPGDSRSVYGV